jgi:putative ABC transport system permease protein
MLKNYIKIAWRNIIKSRFYSLVNIIGLSVGIAFTLLIGAYIYGELQVNRQLRNAGNQYIILAKWTDPNMGNVICTVAQLPKTLKETYPGLVANYYHTDGITTTVSKGDKHFRESLQIGDSTLLNMYGFKLQYGQANKALSGPYSVVTSSDMALKYFGRTNVVGETLRFENFSGNKHDFIITGVMEKTAGNSVTSFGDTNDFFFGNEAAAYFGRNLNGWNNVGTVGYLELKPGIKPEAVEQAIKQLMLKNEPGKYTRVNLTQYLVKLTDYHLTANNGLIKKMIRTLTFIALFILLMAVINFVNICIGSAARRMREMGVRKVLGGLRSQLIWQFLTESTLLVFLATGVALIIYLIVRPFFSSVLGTDISGLFSFPVYFFPGLLLFALSIGLLAGLYPALVLSGLKSVDSLKGKVGSVKESVLFRKTLVGFQFAVAAVVFIGAVIIAQQINLFFKGNLGYNKDYIIYASVPRDWSANGVERIASVRAQLAQLPQVDKVSVSYEITDGHNGGNYLVYRQGAKASGAVSSTGLVSDSHFVDVYNIQMKGGTFFKPYYSPGDSTQIVINETEARAMGWNHPEDAVGQKLILPAYNATVGYTVCGVTADFHFESMQQKIVPITFMNVNYAKTYRFLSIKLKPGNLQQDIANLKQSWDKLLPGAPFEYKFMDEALAKLYKTELQLKKAAYLATGLAVIIVLLGVLGLVSLSVQKRTKEIGIRKVLGSSAVGISLLFLKDFTAVVITAGLIACPVAYLLMNNWLNDYAYKITLSALPFAWAVVALTLVTVVVITLQTIKAAVASPIKSLRTD